MESHNGEVDDLPPLSPLVAGVEPHKADETMMPVKPRSLVQRNDFGRKGQPIKLLTNHFNAEDFFLYSSYVNLKYEDDTPVDRKGSGRKVMEILQQTYAAELANKDFAYDGEKSLFTIGALPQVKNEFTVVVEEVSTGKTLQMAVQAMTVLLEVSGKGSEGLTIQRLLRLNSPFAAKIPMSAISPVGLDEKLVAHSTRLVSGLACLIFLMSPTSCLARRVNEPTREPK